MREERRHVGGRRRTTVRRGDEGRVQRRRRAFFNGLLERLVDQLHDVAHLHAETIVGPLGVLSQVLLAEGTAGHKGLGPGFVCLFEPRLCRIIRSHR